MGDQLKARERLVGHGTWRHPDRLSLSSVAAGEDGPADVLGILVRYSPRRGTGCSRGVREELATLREAAEAIVPSRARPRRRHGLRLYLRRLAEISHNPLLAPSVGF